MTTTLTMFTLYRDPAAAVRWLVDAFGFDVVNRLGPEEGAVAHAELRLGDAVVLVQAAAPDQVAYPVVDDSTSRAPVLCLDHEAAVDALYARAAAAGATTLVPPVTTEWATTASRCSTPRVTSGRSAATGLAPPGEWSGPYGPGVRAARTAGRVRRRARSATTSSPTTTLGPSRTRGDGMVVTARTTASANDAAPATSIRRSWRYHLGAHRP